jgi:transcriptional regulator with XRE-family HTH domain
MEPIGTKIRRQRRRLGLTLDDLAARTAISKPYLSLIETGRVNGPPSDEKLGRIEQVLDLPARQLVVQAHFERTPGDVQDVLAMLLVGQGDDATALTVAALRDLLGEQPPPAAESAPPSLPPMAGRAEGAVLLSMLTEAIGTLAELALKLEPLIAAKAKDNQRRAGGAVIQKSVEAIEARDELATIAGVAGDTIHGDTAAAGEPIADDPARYEINLRCARCDSTFTDRTGRTPCPHCNKRDRVTVAA